jgi:superfamily II DNA helicase RecQ
MEKEIMISKFNEKKGFHNLDFVPKEEQALAALAIANGKNCLCFLPTGFGKTLCYVINSIVHDHPSITLVISPLISLMEDQMKTLREWNFKVARIGDCSSEEGILLFFLNSYNDDAVP